MSNAELTAHKLYDSMHLDNVSSDVKHQLMILILTRISTVEKESQELYEVPNPQSLEEAMNMGAVDLETARKELHNYVDKLAKEYDLQ